MSTSIRTRTALTALALLSLLAPRVAAAQSARYAVVVSGASGGDEYASLYRHWVDGIVRVLRDGGRLDAAHLAVLTEQPASGEEKSTAEVVRAVFARLVKDIKPTDQLFVMLIGHGGGQGGDTKFNLVVPLLLSKDAGREKGGSGVIVTGDAPKNPGQTPGNRRTRR